MIWYKRFVENEEKKSQLKQLASKGNNIGTEKKSRSHSSIPPFWHKIKEFLIQVISQQRKDDQTESGGKESGKETEKSRVRKSVFFCRRHMTNIHIERSVCTLHHYIRPLSSDPCHGRHQHKYIGLGQKRHRAVPAPSRNGRDG